MVVEHDHAPDWAEYAIVTFYAQVWKDDYAVHIWDETYRVPIDAVTDENGNLIEDNSHPSDQLRWHEDAPDKVQNWPHTGYVEIDELQRR